MGHPGLIHFREKSQLIDDVEWVAEVGGAIHVRHMRSGGDRCPCGRLQIRHRGCGEYLAALTSGPARPALGFLTACAVSGDAGSGVHLAIELRQEDERESRAESRRTT